MKSITFDHSVADHHTQQVKRLMLEKEGSYFKSYYPHIGGIDDSSSTCRLISSNQSNKSTTYLDFPKFKNDDGDVKPWFLIQWSQFIALSSSAILAVLMSLYSSFIFNRSKYNLGLPLFAAFVYEMTQLILAALLIILLEWKSGPGLFATLRSWPRRRFIKFILPCSLASAMNIGLSNISLRFVSLSFYTMVKSSGLIFLLLFAFLFRLERPTVTLLGIIAIVGVGLVLTVYDPVSFDPIGFTLVFTSSIVSALRWTLTQVIMTKDNANNEANPINENDSAIMTFNTSPLRTIIYLGPIVTASLLVISLLIEGPAAILASDFFSSFLALKSYGLCIIGGLQAFGLITLEYRCVRETSALTLSIASVVKELLILAVSVLFMGDHLTLINFIGALVSIVGVLLYSYYKTCRSRLSIKRQIKELYLADETVAIENFWIFDVSSDYDATEREGYVSVIQSSSFDDNFRRSRSGSNYSLAKAKSPLHIDYDAGNSFELNLYNSR